MHCLPASLLYLPPAPPRQALSFRGGEPVFNHEGAADVVLADGWMFIHGGDSCDKGGPVGGSIRVVRTLCRLKRGEGYRPSISSDLWVIRPCPPSFHPKHPFSSSCSTGSTMGAGRSRASRRTCSRVRSEAVTR